MKLMIRLLVLSLLGTAVGLAQNSAPSRTGTSVANPGSVLERMPHSLEVRFALSALPSSLRDDATVYVLDPAKGYVLDHAGTNGQNCFVERTEWKYEEYRNDLYTPICYDSAGVKSQTRVRFDVAELRAKGLGPDALKKEIERRFTDGIYKAPDRAGFPAAHTARAGETDGLPCVGTRS